MSEINIRSPINHQDWSVWVQHVQWYYAAPESSPQLVISYVIAGDYFQALHNIIVPAALMVRQQRSFYYYTPERENSS